MTTNLAQWERAQSSRLADLRASVNDRDVLLRLLETSCLLELSRLACAQPGLAVYARMSLEVICEFFPIESCAVDITVAGLAPVHAHRGKPADSPGPEISPLRFELRAAGDPGGWMTVTGDRGGATVEILTALAEQLSVALGTVVAAEELRRRAGAAEAQRAAAAFTNGPRPDALADLANAVSRLPGVLGAEVSASGDGEPCRAGLVGDGAQTDHAVQPGETVTVTLSITWEADPDSDDQAMIGDVVAALGEALGGWEEQERLRRQAETDPLTGLANRRRAARELTAALARADRFSEPVAVMALDLDHFKDVNDTLGHDTGDVVLQAVAGALAQALRGYDLAARMGGEEFLVVCPATTPEAAQVIAGRLLERIPEACSAVLPRGRRQTASLGIAVYPGDGRNAAELLRAADDALYAAKRGGRDRWSFAAAPAGRSR